MGNDNSLNKSYSHKQRTFMFMVILFVSSCNSTINNNNNNHYHNNSNSNNTNNYNNNNNLNETLPSQQQVVTLSNITLFVNSPTGARVCFPNCKCDSNRMIFNEYDYDDKHTVYCQIPDTLKEVPLIPRRNITIHVTDMYVLYTLL